MKAGNEIPKKLRKYFWDVKPSKVDTSKNSLFIIQRLLDKGNDQAVHWVRQHFKDEQIRESFVKLRNFSPRVGNFWSIFFKIPKEKILCLQTPYLKRRKTHWPY